MDKYMKIAIAEAVKSAAEGGVPIGAVLVREGEVLGKGYNKRVQKDSPVLHAEIDCLQNTGRIGSYNNTVLYSTLMPCYLCAGAVIQFKIPKVVVGESQTFPGAREFLEDNGVEVIDLGLSECKELMDEFISSKPDIWNEDIGEL
jgi:cytosine/creatinine deaminase